jgi:hypothetical protein
MVINKLNELLPEIQMDVQHFLHYWQEVKERIPAKYDTSWVKPLILNTYKRDISERLLEETNWK